MLKWKAGHKVKKGGVKHLNHPKSDVDAAAVLRDELGAYDVLEGDPNDMEGENVVYEGFGLENDGEVTKTPFSEESKDSDPVLKVAEMSLSSFKKGLVPILREYFMSEDSDEVRRGVEELGVPLFRFELVKRIITMSMDKKEREKELASRLLSDLFGSVLTVNHMAKGFERLLENVDDLEIDNPDAKKDLANFLARAVADDLLPPAFLADPLVAQLSDDVVGRAKVLLSMRHGGTHIEHVWGVGASATVDDLKGEMEMLLKEYLLSEDLKEAQKCLIELNVPYFHHELVKQAIVLAAEKEKKDRDILFALITFLHSTDVLSEQQVTKGCDRIAKRLKDLALDAPNAGEVYDAAIKHFQATSCLAKDYKPNEDEPDNTSPEATEDN